MMKAPSPSSLALCALVIAASLALVQPGSVPGGLGSLSAAHAPLPSPARGLRGYRRFHANDSYIGKLIPCTKDEKICFRYNTLFIPSRGSCLIGYPKYTYVGDRNRFSNGSGHLIAVSSPFQVTHPTFGSRVDPCSDTNEGIRMAYDGRCYPQAMVRDVICGCDAAPTPHFLGGVECRCSPPAPVAVEQPSRDGWCRVPDLRFPPLNISFLLENPLLHLLGRDFNCSSQQAKCFLKSMVSIPGRSGCFPLRTKGPCRGERLVGLSLRALGEGRAEGACLPVRGGCPKGQIRMLYDGKCHERTEMELVKSGDLELTVYGQYSSDIRATSLILMTMNIQGSDICILQPTPFRARPDWTHRYLISSTPDDNGRRGLYEVEVEAPMPDLDDI